MCYKYKALIPFTKQMIAKYYGISTNQLLEQHYKCYYNKFFVSKFVAHYR